MKRLITWLPLLAIVSVMGWMKPWESLSQAKQIRADIDRHEQEQSQIVQLVPGSIYDGDTLRVTDGKEETKVRLCGIDAPEKEQSMGIAARNHLRSLINKGDGSLSMTVADTDRYGRKVVELFVKPRSGQGYQPGEEIAVNAQMVRDGYAFHYARYSGNCPNGAILTRLEAEAQQEKLGVWSNAASSSEAQRPWNDRRQ